MSASSSPAIAPEVVAHWKVWSDGFASVLSQIAGKPVQAEPTPAPAGSTGEHDLWFVAHLAGGLSGDLFFHLAELSALLLAAAFTGEPTPEGEVQQLSAEQQEAVLELLRQVAGHVATRLPQPGVEIQIEAGGAPSDPQAVPQWFQLSLVSLASIELVASSGLLHALMPSVGETAPELTGEKATLSSQLDTLMDVELSVALRFGGRRMILRDILDLCAGAVVELDRQVQEPVDLLLDGRLVARGDVVVVDGNYGLRVTQIFVPTPQP